MLFDKVKELAKKQGKSLKQVAEDIGLSENALYKWKTQSPKAETLQKVADYFNVTTDYLLGRNNTPMNATNYEVAELDKMLSNDAQLTYASETITEEDKEAINNMIIAYFWSKGRKKLKNPYEHKED